MRLSIKFHFVVVVFGSIFFTYHLFHSGHTVNSDHLTEIIGIFGPFQGLFFFITALLYLLHCWQMMANKFYTYKTDYWCTRPESHAHLSQGFFNVAFQKQNPFFFSF